MSNNACPKCKGARLNKEVLAVTIGDKNIYEFTKMSIKEELEFINSITLSEKERIISDQIVKEIKSRLQFLVNVELNYFIFQSSRELFLVGKHKELDLLLKLDQH